MATSSFFYNGSNAPDETQTQTPPTSTEPTTDSVKTSFYYGSTPGPDQNTFNELVQELNEKIDAAEGYKDSAQSSASSADASAQAAAQSASAAAGSASAALASQTAAQSASTTATQQVAEAEDLLDQANAIISSFTISTLSPTGGTEGDVWFKVTL